MDVDVVKTKLRIKLLIVIQSTDENVNMLVTVEMSRTSNLKASVVCLTISAWQNKPVELFDVDRVSDGEIVGESVSVGMDGVVILALAPWVSEAAHHIPADIRI